MWASVLRNLVLSDPGVGSHGVGNSWRLAGDFRRLQANHRREQPASEYIWKLSVLPTYYPTSSYGTDILILGIA